jgi:glycosyltransferase involved in cell wall biosynthesis
VIDDGVTGFIVKTEEEAVRALKRVSGLSRARCRSTFERRFTACRMAKDYLSIYEALVMESLQPQTVNSIELSTTVLS